MTARAFLAQLAQILEVAEVPYMLAGSLASSYHGEPRSTQDVDIVIHAGADATRRLVKGFGKDDFYVDLDTALDAHARKRPFNVIDMNTGWKVDFIFRKARPFSRTEFERRQRAEVLGTKLWIATKEDVVISKLEWSALSGGSDKQLRDVLGIVRLSGANLDRSYIERWVDELELGERWRRVAEMLEV